MKIRRSLLSLIFITIDLHADKNWIPLEPINNTQISKQTTKKDENLIQNGSIGALMKNVAVLKQLLDSSKKDEDNEDNNKNWYPLDNGKK